MVRAATKASQVAAVMTTAEVMVAGTEAAMATRMAGVAMAMAAMETQTVEDQTPAVTVACSRCSPCKASRK